MLLTTQIISNTIISRPPPADTHPLAQVTSGLSGKPLFDLSTNILREMYILTRGCVSIAFIELYLFDYLFKLLFTNNSASIILCLYLLFKLFFASN